MAWIADDVRARDLLGADLLGIVIASYVALALRYDRLVAPQVLASYLPILILLLAVQTATSLRLGLYSRRWRSASVPDLERIVVAIVLGSLAAAALAYGTSALLGLAWTKGLPRSFWLGEMLLGVAIIGGVRFTIRAASDRAARSDHAGATDPHPTLLYGAGNAGVLVARSALRHPAAGVLPVGFLDDDRGLAGGSVAGIRVFGGLERLNEAVRRTGARALLITMPSASGKVVRRVVDAALALGLEVRTVPSINDLLDGSLDAYRVRQVRVEDLLRRPRVAQHVGAVGEIIQDRTVVITGAGGSIGSELARQVYAIGPRRLVLVDRAESPLYAVQRELDARRIRGKGSGELKVYLANVASRAAMERLISSESPHVIFHAAAYKHVPMMEEHPSDAVYVNIGGTQILLDAAVEAGVERFVFVSTDKAVRPSSVMGASKRIAEMLVAETARRTGRAYVSVRFGNVLGSNGSVVPIFQEQLEKGEALTITHPDMTRFFMTIPEAAWLILDAGALGQSGDLFVLDMGEPVRIMDLARDLVRLSGRDPDGQAYEIVGLRPGEKLHEELFYAGEDIERTPSDKVLRVVAGPPPPSVRDDARQLLAMATGADESALRQALLDYVGGAEERQTAGAHAESLMPGFLGLLPVPADQLAGLPGVALQ
ncbi:MAG: polysaccharide biosynthesis protein [Candidatus Limnocylindrales bacterium]